MITLITKVLSTIKEDSLFKPMDNVIIGVSGGPDSICLLHILFSLKEELNIKIAVAHINHCLRGEDADKDEEYVREYCKKLGIPFYCKRINIKQISKERGISCEVAGREGRYEFFKELTYELNCNKVALAHNANDQVETIIMRLIRGTGLQGLTGIKSIRDNIYVRPLIKVQRSEIEEYCRMNNLEPRIDKTNQEEIYDRNKVRLQLIPYINNNFNKDVITTVNRMVDLIRVDNDYLEEQAQEKYKILCDEKKDKVIIRKELFNEHTAIINRVIINAISKIKGQKYNIEKVHIDDIIELGSNITGKEVALPGNIVAHNNYGNIEIYRNSKNIENINTTYKLYEKKNNNIHSMNIIINLNVINNDNKDKNYKNYVLTKYFDYDKIDGDISIRYRKNGDRIIPMGMKGSKKLKDLFIDLKINAEDRDKIPIITFGNDIAWVVGYRTSEKYKVKQSTKKILVINIERGE